MPDIAFPHDQPGGSEERRCYLNVLVSDLCGSTRISDKTDPQRIRSLQKAVQGCFRNVISKHGGIVNQVMGDGVVALFGYPEPREDDGRRAAEAALELRDAIQALEVPDTLRRGQSLHLRSGIHSGLVTLGTPLDAAVGMFDVSGMVVNVAERLREQADPDGILINASTLSADSHFFEVRDRSKVALKGVAKPIDLFEVHARAPIGTRFEARTRRGLTPLVGRQNELRELLRAFTDAASGQPRIIEIIGDPGMGKTRLVEEFLARTAAASDCGFYRGYCESYLSAEPLQPFLQILRALCGLERGLAGTDSHHALDGTLAGIDPALMELRQEFLVALSLGATAGEGRQIAREEVVAAFVRVFDVLARQQPVVLFIDDWQWADDATRQVLDGLHMLRNRAMMTIITSRERRPGDPAARGATVLELPPLTDDESKDAIRLPPASNPLKLPDIVKRAGGNPLFIEELCHSVASGEGGGASGADSPSAWLDTMIASRVERLPRDQRRLADTAAVIGNVIPRWLLDRISGGTVGQEILEQLKASDVLFPQDDGLTLRFKHGKTRDVIYALVDLNVRTPLHRALIAEYLDQQSASGTRDEFFEALAYHYDGAGDAARAAEYAGLAGDKAMAASALDRARKQYRAALDALDRLPDSDQRRREWNAIAERLGAACVYDVTQDELPLFEDAVGVARSLRDHTAIARAEYWLGYINYAMGDARATVEHCQKALDHAALAREELGRGGHDSIGVDKLATQIEATLGQALATCGELDQAIALLDKACSMKRERGLQSSRSGRTASGPAVGFAYSLAVKGGVLAERGRFGDAHQCFDEALDAVRGASHHVEASILGWRGAAFLWQGRWREALESASAGRSIGQRTESLWLFAKNQTVASYASWMLEQKPESLDAMVKATRWLEESGKRLAISLNYAWLAEALVAAAAGDPPDGPLRYAVSTEWMAGHEPARVWAERALARVELLDPMGERAAYRAMARLAAGGRDPHGRSAEAYLDLAMRSAQARRSPPEEAVTILHRALWLAESPDRRTQALTLVNQAREMFQAMDMQWYLDIACRLEQRLRFPDLEHEGDALGAQLS